MKKAELLAPAGSESRLNTAYIAANNVFSALGGVLAIAVGNAGAWVAVASGGAIIAILALATWFFGIRKA